jgi:[ribosomal protein S5]-alanine N-acetyltransferase
MNGAPIETERLVLREYVADDIDAVHAYASDPAVVEFMLWGPNTPDETAQFVERAIQCSTERPRTTFGLALTLRDGGTLLGGCGLHIREPAHSAAEIGYCLARPAWGRGYATEAAGALLEFGFVQLGLHRIYAMCDTRNVASSRVLAKCGMRREGHFVEDVRHRGAWRDSLYYAILEREWQQP